MGRVGSQTSERSSATMRKGIYSPHLHLLRLCCPCFENEYSSVVTGPEEAVFSDFSTVAMVPKHLSSQLLSMNSHMRFCASCIGRAVMKNRVWILSLGKRIIQLIYSINSRRTAGHTVVDTKQWLWGQNTVPKDSSLQTSFL